MLRIAIAGCAGHGYLAMEALPSLPDVQLCAYCETYPDEDLSGITNRMANMGLSAPCYDGYEEMILKEKPDIVVVDTRFGDHAKAAIFALEQGAHVFVDKPLATTLEDYELLQRTQQHSDRILWGMFTLRYDPWFYTAKRLLDQGEVGEIRLLNAQKSYRLGRKKEFFNSRESYGGTIPWVSIHAIDLISWMANKPFHSVMALHSNAVNNGHGELETTAACVYELEDGIIATQTTDYLRPENADSHGDDRIRVVGSKGVLEVVKNEVYLTNDQHACQKMPLVAPEQIFVDFVHVIQGKSQGLITAEQSLYATYVSLISRESADLQELLHL